MGRASTPSRVRAFGVLVAVVGLFALVLGGVAEAGFTGDTPTFVTKWGSSGTGDGQFNQPWAVAVDSVGDVYVTDRSNHRLQKFTSNGSFVTEWGGPGSGDGEFNNPYGVAVDGDDNVYVADGSNGRIQQFTSSGDFIAEWGDSGPLPGEFNNPIGVAVDGDDNVYVADTGNDRVQKFDANFDYLTEWGSSGAGDGQFDSPGAVAVDSVGDVYVADLHNHRVQKFTSSGAFLTKWGSFGTGDGQFQNPYGLAADGDGNIYVVDHSSHRIQKFTPTGEFVTKWGSSGGGDGQFSNPIGVAADDTGNVYVADFSNDRIQKFFDGRALATFSSVGIGTESPGGDLEVMGNDGVTQVLITETSGTTAGRNLLALENNGPVGISLINTDNAETWDITGGGSFTIGHPANPPFLIETGAPTHSLVMTDTGVGIGTATPTRPLHVTRDDGTTNLFIQETSAVRERRFLVDLENNGPNGVRLTNTETAVSWEFATAGADNFSISRVGTSGNEFSLRPNGRLVIGPGNQIVFDLKPNGNLKVDGTITDGSGTTLGDLAAENQTLRDRVADLEARLAAMEAALAQLTG